MFNSSHSQIRWIGARRTTTMRTLCSHIATMLLLFSTPALSQELRDRELVAQRYTNYHNSIQGLIVDSDSVETHLQDSVEHNGESSQISLPRFDVHVGMGWVNGGRIGGRVQFDNHWSGEIAFGYDWRNFVSASNITKRYSFGVNWHKGGNSKLALSLLAIYNKYVYFPNERYLISPNVGILSLRERGLRFFGRLGIFFEFYQDVVTGKMKYDGIGINVDIGLLWSFP